MSIRLRFSFFAAAMIFVAASAPPTEAARKKVQNCYSGVCTRIILDWNGSKQDVCFAHNSNNRAVRAEIDVFPGGVFGTTTDTVHAVMSPLEDQKIDGWINGQTDWHKESCLVTSVR